MADSTEKGLAAISFKKLFRRKTAVFIDYANVKAWAKRHNYLLNLQVLYLYLIKRGISKVSLYYGNDPKNPSSLSFLNKLRTFGYEIITKEVKYIRVSLLDLFKKPINRQLLNKLSTKTRSFLLKEGELYQNSDLTVFFHDLIKEIPNFAIKNPGRTGEKL